MLEGKFRKGLRRRGRFIFQAYACLAVAILLVSITLPAFIGLRAFFSNPSLQHLSYLINKGQTLIAGFWATSLATVGGILVWHQITTTRQIEAERRFARRMALKAALPMVLSPLSRYLKQNAELLEKLYRDVKSVEYDIVSSHPPPDLPEYIAPRLQETVEAEAGDAVLALTYLLQDLQILESRMVTSLDFLSERKVITKHVLCAQIVDTVIVQARVEAMFVYARAQADRTKYTFGKSDFISPVMSLIDAPEQINNLYEMLDHRLDAFTSGSICSLM